MLLLRFRQPVLMANSDIHEAELEARNFKMKQVIELYEDGDHAWKTERQCLREANTQLKEANDKLRADLQELARHRELLTQPLRREIEQLKISLGKERVGKATVMKANFHLQRQLRDIRSILETHCDQVRLHLHDLGAVMSRKRTYSASADNVDDDDDDDSVSAKKERSDRSSSSDDDLPPAFTVKDTPAAGSSVSGGRRVLKVRVRRNSGATSSSAVAPSSSSSDLRNSNSIVDDE